MTTRIGLNLGGAEQDLHTIRALAGQAAEDGLASLWMSQHLGHDALTALAVVGQEIPDLELGVSVVPVYGRHPLVLAMQARTVQAAVDGRLTLGIGPSHQFTVEAFFGGSYAKPYTRTKEYLSALLPLLAGEPVDLVGEEVTACGQIDSNAPSAPPVLIAGLRPRMLRLAGTVAAGTTLWMVGPHTIASHVTPVIRRAAESAGRPEPRILAGVTAVVTDDPADAHQRAATQQALYGLMPAYRHMLDAEGVAGPADLVIAGNEAIVADGLQRYADAGVTDLRVSVLAANDDERDRTRAVLRTLARSR